MDLLYSLFFVLSTINCLSSAYGLRAEKIIGGLEASQYQLKYVVAVMYNSQMPNVLDHNPCTGAIIDDWLISTIAQCFYNETGGFRNEEFYVAFSVADLQHPVITSRYIGVDLVIMPNEYHPHVSNSYSSIGNVAVIKLAEKIKLQQHSRYLEPLIIAPDLYITQNVAYTVAGYGWNNIVFITDIVNDTVSELILGESDGKLRYASADILDRRFCQDEILYGSMGQGKICVQIRQDPGDNKGICEGDSGAPLVLGELLVGLAIYNFPYCNEKYMPGIYISVPFYYEFFTSVLSSTTTSNMRILQLRKTSLTNYEFIQI